MAPCREWIRRPERRGPGSPAAAAERLRQWRGLTYIEILVAVVVLLVLAGAVMELHHWADKRRREKLLRLHLETMRDAIKKYKEYADAGLIIQEDVEQWGFPRTLEELVEGVEVGQNDPHGSLEPRKIKFLYEIPEDPFTGEPEWGRRSYQDDWDSDSWGGENVWDVYSLSDLPALDGTYYREW